MGVEVPREKSLPFLVRLAYLLNRLPRRSDRSRLSLLLDLEWAVSRLCHEESYATFDSPSHPSRIATREFLRSCFPGDSVVLDVGCGSGDLLIDLGSLSRTVIGIDHSATAVEEASSRLAEARLDNVTVRVGDAVEFLTTIDRKVDVVICSHILEHLDDPAGLVRSLARVSRFIYVEVPDFEAVASNAFREVMGRSLMYSDLDHVREFDRGEMGELLSSSGLAVRAEDHRLGMLRYWCEIADPA